MGYTTEFRGSFTIDKKLDNETYDLLVGLATTRRMKRSVGPEYGVEGEFYIEGGGDFGQAKDDTIIDYNRPPRTQPGLWCQWQPTYDKQGIEWDGGEKFYSYIPWLRYIIEKVLEPRGYKLEGEVQWRGEDWSDTGTIVVRNNQVETV